jgi:hypothetical protein
MALRVRKDGISTCDDGAPGARGSCSRTEGPLVGGAATGGSADDAPTAAEGCAPLCAPDGASQSDSGSAAARPTGTPPPAETPPRAPTPTPVEALSLAGARLAAAAREQQAYLWRAIGAAAPAADGAQLGSASGRSSSSNALAALQGGVATGAGPGMPVARAAVGGAAGAGGGEEEVAAAGQGSGKSPGGNQAAAPEALPHSRRRRKRRSKPGGGTLGAGGAAGRGPAERGRAPLVRSHKLTDCSSEAESDAGCDPDCAADRRAPGQPPATWAAAAAGAAGQAPASRAASGSGGGTTRRLSPFCLADSLDEGWHFGLGGPAGGPGGAAPGLSQGSLIFGSNRSGPAGGGAAAQTAGPGGAASGMLRLPSSLARGVLAPFDPAWWAAAPGGAVAGPRKPFGLKLAEYALPKEVLDAAEVIQVGVLGGVVLGGGGEEARRRGEGRP